MPRITLPGFTALHPVAVRLPPAPDDPIDATRLSLRLAALAAALDDLPRHARRFARWQARNQLAIRKFERGETGSFRRFSPLRPGRPPGHINGSAPAKRQRTGEISGSPRQGRARNMVEGAETHHRAHEVYEVLADLQWFARQALDHPDTS